jgi:hypothetical protein
MAARPKPVAVYLELGNKKVFAGAFDWPGWARFGKDEETALGALADYVPRYAPVAEAAGVPLPATAGDAFAVVERLSGSGSTDFGAPGAVPERDREPVRRKDAERLSALVDAAWKTFERGAAKAPAELRKGPRGGGRDRDKMIDHVVQAEFSYARSIGVKHRPAPFDDTAAVAALRADILAVLREPAEGKPLGMRGWPTPYAARRIAWHVLDHLWEMEDRAEPA